MLSSILLKNVLESAGYIVSILNTAIGIVDVILDNNIDVVILDIIMPEISGYEALHLLKNCASTRDIPVVIITELTAASEVKKALDLGAMDFVRKSSEPIEILARVMSAIRFKENHDQLVSSSQRDHLTQLYNRQFFNKTAEILMSQRMKYPNGLALIMVDVDCFKHINDTYGHISGDEILSYTANAIVKSVKKHDVVCRFGGEEFCVILINATPAQAYVVAERIRGNVEKMRFTFCDISKNSGVSEVVIVTVSCGVNHMESDDCVKSFAALINEADIALYEAKRNGRNQVICFGDIQIADN